MLAPVGRAEHTAFLLGPGTAPEGTDKNHSRIGGMNQNAPDSAGFLETHPPPGLAPVGRPIDAVPHHVGVANHPGFAGADPNDVVIGGIDGDSPDRRGRFLIENRLPFVAAVCRFPDSSRRGPGVVSGRIPGNPGDRSDPISHYRTHKAKAEGVFVLGTTSTILSRRRNDKTGGNEQRSEPPFGHSHPPQQTTNRVAQSPECGMLWIKYPVVKRARRPAIRCQMELSLPHKGAGYERFRVSWFSTGNPFPIYGSRLKANTSAASLSGKVILRTSLSASRS